VRRPHQERSRRVGQFGDDADQLAVKTVRPIILMMRHVPDDPHGRAVRAGQPHRDVAVVVEADDRDIPRPHDLGTLVVRYPYFGHVPASSPPAVALRALSPLPPASVPARRASTSPTVRSLAVGSGSGRCAWT
jgi:hypothetical protein